LTLSISKIWKKRIELAKVGNKEIKTVPDNDLLFSTYGSKEKLP
jgi:hypothetical protein